MYIWDFLNVGQKWIPSRRTSDSKYTFSELGAGLQNSIEKRAMITGQPFTRLIYNSH